MKRCIVVPPGAHDGGALATTTNLADGGDGHQAWADFMRAGKLWAKQHGNCATHVCASDDISNILFSSGTTGDPKAIPWSHVTPIRCGSDAFAHHDIRERDVVCWPTNLGWMMGPWLLYAALLNGAAVAIKAKDWRKAESGAKKALEIDGGSEKALYRHAQACIELEEAETGPVGDRFVEASES